MVPRSDSSCDNRQHLAYIWPFTDVNLFARDELQGEVTQMVVMAVCRPRLSAPESLLLPTSIHHLLIAFCSPNVLKYHNEQQLFL